jgi:tetratricopeptide (TPR) repeat protein
MTSSDDGAVGPGPLDAVREALEQVGSAVADVVAAPLDRLLGIADAAGALPSLRSAIDDTRGLLDALAARCDAASELAALRRRYEHDGLASVARRLRRAAAADSRRADRMLVAEWVSTVSAAGTLTAGELLDLFDDPGQDSSGATEPAPDEHSAWVLAQLRRATDHLGAGDWDAAGDDIVALLSGLGGSTRRTGSSANVEDELALMLALTHEAAQRTTDAEAVLLRRLGLHDDSRLRIELSAALLLRGEIDQARSHARIAAEDEPQPGDGSIALAAVAEAAGDVAVAAEQYGAGFARWGVRRLAQPERVTLRFFTGLYLRELAAAQMRVGLAEEALSSCRDALARGVSGPEPYPDAGVYLTRARALQSLDADVDAIRESLYEVAKRGVWSADPGSWDEGAEQTLALLRELTDGTPDLPMAGWYLADLLRVQAWRGGAPPAHEPMVEAEQQWSSWLARTSAPPEDESWVYWSGANILEDLDSSAPDEDQGLSVFAVEPVSSSLWEAVVRIEKALCLEPGSPGSWATDARLLQTVGLTDAARESRAKALELDPHDAEARWEHLADLARDNRPREALEVLAADDVGDATQRQFVRAWAELRDPGNQAGQRDLPVPGLTRWNPTSAHVLRHAVHTRRRELDEARADLEQIVAADPADRSAALHRINALALLGRLDEAAALLPELSAYLVDVEHVLPAVVVEACLGRAGDALAHAASVVRVATSDGELRDAEYHWSDAEAWLRADPARGAAADVLAQARGLLVGATPGGRAEGDGEAGQMVERYANDPWAVVALRVVRARRLRERGELEGAYAAYEQLVGTRFDPEATIALHDVARSRLADAVAHGRVEEATRMHEMLAGSGWSPYLTSAMVAAEAHENAGEHREALEVLRAAAATPDQDPSTRAQVELWLGMREASTDPAEGLRRMREAAEAAALAEDPDLAARIDARLGVLTSALGGRGEEVAGFFLAALKGLYPVDDAPFALEFEIRRAASFVRGAASGSLYEAYRAACRSAGVDAVPWGMTPLPEPD